MQVFFNLLHLENECKLFSFLQENTWFRLMHFLLIRVNNPVPQLSCRSGYTCPTVGNLTQVFKL